MNTVRKFGHQTFSSLKIRNYRLYFIGQGISLAGTWMQMIAQGLLVLQLTNSGTTLGIVLALQFLPILLFGPIAGVFIDRYSKRKLLFFTQTASGLLALTLGLLLFLGLVQLWMVYAFAICFGFVMAIDSPARQSFLMEMVGKDGIKNAIALNSSEVNLMRILGPALGGILIATVGLVGCFFFNAFSYVAVLIMLAAMRVHELHVSPSIEKEKGQLREGFRYVWNTPILRNVLLIVAVVGMFSYEFPVILPIFAKFTFHNTVNGYALLMSAMGLGSIVGGVFAAGRHAASSRLLSLSLLFFGIFMLLTSFMPTLNLAVLMMVLVGVFSVSFISIANTILQMECLPSMRGRVMSLWSVAFLGSTPIGGPIIGWIGQHFGAPYGMGVGGIVAIGAAIFGMVVLKTEKSSRP